MPFMIQLAICTFASLRVERGWLKSLAAFTFVALTADEPGGVTFIGKKKGGEPEAIQQKTPPERGFSGDGGRSKD